MKWHFTKNFTICCLFCMFIAFRIHIDTNIWVKNMLKKVNQTHSKLLKSHSKISEFWCFFVLKISDYSFWNSNYSITAWPIEKLNKRYVVEHKETIWKPILMTSPSPEIPEIYLSQQGDDSCLGMEEVYCQCKFQL